MNNRSIGLVPLRNFAVIDSKRKIYRSAQPLYGYEYRWLKDVLRIGKLFNLRSEASIDEKMATSLGIGVENIQVPDHKPPTMGEAMKFMDEIRNAKVPILIHCEHGHGRTSTFTVLARIALGWHVNKAIEEEEKKFHYHFKHNAQKEFLLKNFS